jgi:hypothetical protein
MADRIDQRSKSSRPARGALKRTVFAPPDLFAMNENLLGGYHGDGSADIRNQPSYGRCFRTSRRTPVRGLYLGSSYAHPARVQGCVGSMVGPSSPAAEDGEIANTQQETEITNLQSRNEADWSLAISCFLLGIGYFSLRATSQPTVLRREPSSFMTVPGATCRRSMPTATPSRAT